MPKTLLAAFAVLALVPAMAQPVDPSPEPARIEGSAPWGTIKRVVEPEYPQALIDSKAKGYVDISGRVTYYGALVDVIYTPGSEEAGLMVEPLRDVMKYWSFVPPMDHNCVPSGRVVKNRVSFEFDGEKPRLSVSHAVGEPRESPSVKAISRVNPTYPRSMQVNGWQAFVFSRVTIDPEGNVVDVVAEAFPREEGVDLTHFTIVTARALKRWTFNPDPGAKGNRFACYDVVYRLN